MRLSGSRDYRRTSDARTCTYAGKYAFKIEYITVYGISQRKSVLMIFDEHANLKYKFENRHFWAEGYYVSTAELNEATIKKYIQEQKVMILQWID